MAVEIVISLSQLQVSFTVRFQCGEARGGAGSSWASVELPTAFLRGRAPWLTTRHGQKSPPSLESCKATSPPGPSVLPPQGLIQMWAQRAEPHRRGPERASRLVHLTTHYGWSVQVQAHGCHLRLNQTRKGRKNTGDRKNMVSLIQPQIHLPLGLPHFSHPSLGEQPHFAPPHTHTQRKRIHSYKKRIL